MRPSRRVASGYDNVYYNDMFTMFVHFWLYLISVVDQILFKLGQATDCVITTGISFNCKIGDFKNLLYI